MRNYTAAIESYEEFIEIYPEDYFIWIQQGDALANLGKYNEAISSYQCAIEILLDKAEACYNTARSYAIQNNLVKASEHLRKAIALASEEYREKAITDSYFDPIATNPAFKDLVDRER